MFNFVFLFLIIILWSSEVYRTLNEVLHCIHRIENGLSARRA